ALNLLLREPGGLGEQTQCLAARHELRRQRTRLPRCGGETATNGADRPVDPRRTCLRLALARAHRADPALEAREAVVKRDRGRGGGAQATAEAPARLTRARATSLQGGGADARGAQPGDKLVGS